MQKLLINIVLFLLTVATATASDYRRTGSGMTFEWQDTDYVGVYTTGGVLIKYYPSSISGKYATMQSGFGLADNTDYYAYSPYNKGNWNKSLTALPISYLNQAQKGNGNAAHLSAYDYQMAKFTTGTASSASFSFNHVGAVINLKWTMPSSSTYKLTAITLKATSPIFTDSATMNLPSQTITPVTTSDSVTLALNKISIDGGCTLSAYLMLPPTDFTGDTLDVTLRTAAGETFVARVIGTKVNAGYIYPISIGTYDYLTNEAKASATEMNPTTASSVVAYSPDFNTDVINTFTTFALRGDVNRDGRVNVSDVSAVISVICGGKDYRETADVTGDGKVTVSDVSAVISIICKK